MMMRSSLPYDKSKISHLPTSGDEWVRSFQLPTSQASRGEISLTLASLGTSDKINSKWRSYSVGFILCHKMFQCSSLQSCLCATTLTFLSMVAIQRLESNSLPVTLWMQFRNHYSTMFPSTTIGFITIMHNLNRIWLWLYTIYSPQ